MPVPPGRIPIGTSIWFTTVLPSSPKRMSQLAASSLPPPPTRPATTQIVALGIVRRRSHIWWNALCSVSRSTGPLVGNRRMSLDVEMGDEEVRVGRTQHEHAYLRIVLHLCGERRELREQLEGHEVDRRVVDVAVAIPSTTSTRRSGRS